MKFLHMKPVWGLLLAKKVDLGKRRETVNNSSMGAEAQTTWRSDRKHTCWGIPSTKNCLGCCCCKHYSLDLSHSNLVIPWTLPMSNTQHYQRYHGTLLTPFVRHEAKATLHAEGCEATYQLFPCDPHCPGHAVLQVDYTPLSPGMSPLNINVPPPIWKYRR